VGAVHTVFLLSFPSLPSLFSPRRLLIKVLSGSLVPPPEAAHVVAEASLPSETQREPQERGSEKTIAWMRGNCGALLGKEIRE
jgi:hypothetical protein